MKKKILITGVTGFLGKNLVNALRRTGTNVFATAAHENKNLKINKMDFLIVKDVRKTINLAKPEVIYHTGGLVNLSRNYETYKNCFEANVIGTLNILESLRDNPPKKFIFVSTEEIYGNNKTPYKETQEADPPSGYSISKIAAEKLCMSYAKELGFKLIILRVGTMYGPGDRLSRLIPQIVMQATQNKTINLNLGLKKRDYVFIDDVVKALISSKNSVLPDSITVINIGGGKSYSLRRIVSLIISYTKSKSKVNYGVVAERAGEREEWLLDIKKALKVLHWEPKISMIEGLKKTVDFYCNS